jgi:hypothetical protein
MFIKNEGCSKNNYTVKRKNYFKGNKWQQSRKRASRIVLSYDTTLVSKHW